MEKYIFWVRIVLSKKWNIIHQKCIKCIVLAQVENRGWKSGNYFLGCWILFNGLFGTLTGGFCWCATWLAASIVDFKVGELDNCTAVSNGLFWANPIFLIKSNYALKV
jgi:hypothetical protein